MPEPRCCEQGYAVFLEGLSIPGGPFLRGHVGIFEGCDGSGDHRRAARQFVWESLPDRERAVQQGTCSEFRDRGTFLGIRTQLTGLSPVQQRIILESVRAQQGLPSDYFRWMIPGHSFRCDGLVCWAYGEARIDFGYTAYNECWPLRLFDRLRCVP